MHTENLPTEKAESVDRWTLIRDIAVFQVKLIVDGLRDLLLVPVSMVAGLVSLFRGGDEPGPEFYDLLRVGRRSEHWINLFGAAERLHGPPADDARFPGEDIDEMVSRVESFIVDEFRKGGVPAQARERMHRAINRLGNAASGKRR